MDTFDDDENKENSYLSDGGDDFGGTTGFGGGNEDAYRNVFTYYSNFNMAFVFRFNFWPMKAFVRN